MFTDSGINCDLIFINTRTIREGNDITLIMPNRVVCFIVLAWVAGSAVGETVKQGGPDKKKAVGCMVNGTLYKEGEGWKDDCNHCTCMNGSPTCTLMLCAKPGYCPPDNKPSSKKCKDKCQTDFDCKGERKCCKSGCGLQCVTPAKDDCSLIDCMPLTCALWYTPAGSCCPVCKKKGTLCKKNGKKYREGDRVPSSDPCESCSCTGGRVICAMMSCARPPCDEFHNPPGQCCPVCTGSCLVDGTKYRDGDHVPDDNPCSFCQCNNGKVECAIRDCAAPNCDDYYVPPGECCPICHTGSCLVDGMTYQDGQEIPDNNPCSFCRCENGEVECAIIDCAPPPCKDYYSVPDQCCPVCPKGDLNCKVGDKVYKDLEELPDKDPCTRCICNRGKVACSTQFCGLPECAHPYTPPGECCPVCKNGSTCDVNGTRYQDGNPVPSKDPCKTCQCDKDTVRCDPVPCLLCIGYTPPGACCPICGLDPASICRVNGAIYKDGEHVPNTDPCKDCKCSNGKVTCDPVVCIACVGYTPPGACCPICGRKP